MSYKYLSLDKSQITFEQVKNLLANNELLYITQDARNDIIKCRKYLDKNLMVQKNYFKGLIQLWFFPECKN